MQGKWDAIAHMLWVNEPISNGNALKVDHHFWLLLVFHVNLVANGGDILTSIGLACVCV